MAVSKRASWGVTVEDKNCFQGKVKFFAPASVGSPLGKPDCAYLKGFPCGVFMASKDRMYGESVCCSYDSDGGMSRCSMLPSFVKNGFRSANFYNGKLHGDF